MSGLFIVCDGVDGAGKTTQSKKLTEFIENSGRQALWTREPGGSPAAERIRTLLLSSNKGEEPSARAELLLHGAARADHLERTVRPALAAGKVVICDRFIDSTFAYQGGGGGLDDALIAECTAIATGGLSPDLTLIFTVSEEIARQRMEKRDGAAPKNRYERENAEYYARVGEAYRKRARQGGEKYALIDASGGEEEVFAQVKKYIEPLLQSQEVLACSPSQ